MDKNIIKEITDTISVKDILQLFNIDIKDNFIHCPMHDDNKPSMYVYKNAAYCFVCNSSLNIFGLVMTYKNLNFYDALKFIIQEFNLNYNINNKQDKKTKSWLIEYNIFKKQNRLFLKSLKQYYLELIKSFDTFLDIHNMAGYYKKMYAHHKPKNDIVFYELNQKSFPDGLFKNLDYLKKTENFLAKHWILPDFEEIKSKVNDGYLFSKVVNLMEDTLKNSSQ